VIPLEGRALPGLDEFMLRLGHLTVLCQAAVQAGGAAHRFAREAAERLTRLVPVPDESFSSVARYLKAKKLCPELSERKAGDFDEKKFRYPDIVLTAKDEEDSIESWPAGAPVKIFWQDLCLSADGVPSRVGSVTAHGRHGSKTGLSHVIDWATMLDLTNASGLPFAHGQLVANFNSPARPRGANPYLLGNERLVFADLVIRSDFDVFAALVTSLASKKDPLRKKEATQEYIDAVQGIADAAESARQLSQRQRQNLFSLWRDLRRRGHGDELITSTAWHRAASRFETYVDLGLLRKGIAGEQERYEYKYYVADALREIRETLNAARDAEHWLDEFLVDSILGKSCAREAIPPEQLVELLPAIMAPLARPTSPLPIDTLALGLIWLAADMGRPVTLGAARRSIEELATRRPDLARLSTGSTTRAEYISIRLGGTHHEYDAGSGRV
jgi:hypothetical protein